MTGPCGGAEHPGPAGTAGGWIDLGTERISGEAFRDLIVEASGRRVRIIGGSVAGPVDLASVTVAPPVEVVETAFDGPVDLTGSSFSRLRLERCHLLDGLVVIGTRVAGDLDLQESTVRGALVTAASATRGAALWLTEAEIGGRLLAAGTTVTALAGSGDRPARAIHGDRLRVGNNIRLIDGFQADGEVRLVGAEIGGSLDLTSCHLHSDDDALDLASATIGGNLFVVTARGGAGSVIDGRLDLSNATVSGHTLILGTSFRARTAARRHHHFEPDDRAVAVRASGATFRGEVNLAEGCTVNGRIDLRAATFGTGLDLHDTVFTTEAGSSLDLSAATIGTDLRLGRRSRAVRLINTTIGGSLLGNGTTIEASGKRALAGRGLRVGGDLTIEGVTVRSGVVDLRRSHIGGDLLAAGARLDGDGELALALSSAQILGSAYLGVGFRAGASVRFDRALVGGRLVLDGADLRPGRDRDGRPLAAVQARLLTATGGMYLDWAVTGAVDLRGSTTSVLGDRADRWGDSYRIGGFTYDRFDGTQPGDADTAGRIRWLIGQDDLDASSFEQLADYYRRHGRTVDAEKVLIARNRALRASRAASGGWPNRVRNGIDRIWDLSVGYGYRAGRAGGLLLCLVIATAWALSLPAAAATMRTADQDNVVYSPNGPLDDGADAAGRCGSGRVRCFDPVFYAVDTVVPLIDLHQRSTWYPDRGTPHGRLYELGLDIGVLLGWVCSSALVLGVTHAIGPGRR